MKMFKNLCGYLTALCFLSFITIWILSMPKFDWIHVAFFSAPISTFSVSLVCLVGSFVMYKSTQAVIITTLKRRAGRVYGELLHHKMRIVDIIDGKRSFAEIEKYLYPEDAFLKIKKFLYEEYFVLYIYDPFFKNTPSYHAVKDFISLHRDLETFIRSQNFDIIEYNNFKVLYQKTYRQPIIADTPEENFSHPDLVDAMDSFNSGLDYALINADNLMVFIEAHLISLDKYFGAGVPWPITKAHFDSEFQHWIHANN